MAKKGENEGKKAEKKKSGVEQLFPCIVTVEKLDLFALLISFDVMIVFCIDSFFSKHLFMVFSICAPMFKIYLVACLLFIVKKT